MEFVPETARWARTSTKLLLVLLAALLVHSAWRVGPTYDEHYYIVSGLNYLELGDFSLNREHPPLLKMLMAAPIWGLWKLGLLEVVWPPEAVGLPWFPASFLFQLNASSLDLLLFLARLPMIALTLWMVAALASKVRTRFGPHAGLAALLLAGFNPNQLAHGHLAALDSGVTVLLLLATLAFVELLEAPGPRRALVAGLLFGLANLAKSTALVLGPATLGLALFVALRARNLRPLAWTLCVWFAGLGVFSLGYGFETKSLNEAWGDSHYISTGDGGEKVLFTQPLLERATAGLFGDTQPIPLFSALKGLDYQLEQSQKGHFSFYAGESLYPEDFVGGNPHPWYYAHVLLLKNPLPFLGLFALGLLVALCRGPGWNTLLLLAMFGFPALLFATFSTSKMLMGVRYLLPVIPFMAFVGASLAVRLPRLTLALAGLSALSGIAAHPHELMYYNLAAGGNDLRTGGPATSPVGDDWGQGVRAVGRYHQAHHAELEALGGLYYTPLSAAGPTGMGLLGVRPVERPVQGIVAVHALNYWRDTTSRTERTRKYAWLDAFEPFLVLDDSVYFFDTRPDAPVHEPGFDPVEAARRAASDS